MIKVLKIKIDNLDESGINDWILNVLSGNAVKKFVCTLNPEIVLKGHRDSGFRKILNGADMNLCDGVGLKLAAWIDNHCIRARYTGFKLVESCLIFAGRFGLKVLVVMSKKSISKPKEIESAISKKYSVRPNTIYYDTDEIFNLDEVRDAEIIFVNFGSPDQEKFIFENREKFRSARLLAGVGGTFDFMTGRIARAPIIFQKLGMEWFWRLLVEPKRISRIWQAVVIFPLCCLRARVSGIELND